FLFFVGVGAGSAVRVGLISAERGDTDPRDVSMWGYAISGKGTPASSACVVQSRTQGQVVDRLEPLEGDEDLALGLELAKHGAQNRLELESAACGDAVGRGPCEGFEVRTKPRRPRHVDRDNRFERRGEG